MSTVRKEITELEEQLRLAELAPDSTFFEERLDEKVVLIDERGNPLAKSKIVEAHRPAAKKPFTDVTMSDMQIVDHGTAAVVTCKGRYTSDEGTFTLTFMRVWLKRNNYWQIIAGTVSK